MSKLRNKLLGFKYWVFLLPILFFAIAFITLKDYGISWDEPIHFIRGQTYLNHFLKNDDFALENNIRNTAFRSGSLDIKYFIENDGAHGPLNDILASLSNLIFFQKLGILGDIESYHLFNIFASTILVFVVVAFAYQTYGTLAALISGIVISTYPLFFAESHFNIKDPPQAAFYALCIWAFYNSLKKFSWKWLLLSSISCGFCVSMKLNVIFLPLILIPYLIIRYGGKFTKTLRIIPKSYYITLVLVPIIIFGIYYASWPLLWQNTLENLKKIFFYYKDIGIEKRYQSDYYLLGFNTFPLIWIATTTPISVLVSLMGGLGVYLFVKRNDRVNLLWVLWFAVPILRVVVPKTSIYGGVRQVMEYVAPLALISGFFISWIIKRIYLKNKAAAIIFAVCILIEPLFITFKYHPNQNVYFNLLIGGLKGAREKNLPSWGNSFGNAYKQVTDWLNKNIDNKKVNLALIEGTSSNIPLEYLNPNITFNNNNWSGLERKGEYLLELTHQGTMLQFPYAADYVNRFLNPVYEVKVDGVAIAKLWKNDLEHTFPEWRLEEENYTGSLKVEKDDKCYSITLSRLSILSRLILEIKKLPGLTDSTYLIYTSEDGENFVRQKELINFDESKLVSKSNTDIIRLEYFLAGVKTKKLEIRTVDFESCNFVILNADLMELK